MSAERLRPLWLSVPAASGPRHGDVDDAHRRHWRLLHMVADHGLSLSEPSSDAHAGSDPVQVLAAELEGMQAPCWLTLCPPEASPALGATMKVLDLGRFTSEDRAIDTEIFSLARGSADTRREPAMSYHQLDQALSVGRQAVERAKLDGVEAIAVRGDGAGAAATNRVWASVLGQGSGATDCVSMRPADRHQPHCSAQQRTQRAILARHAGSLHDPYRALRHLGGLEHAALVGATLAAAQIGLPLSGLGLSAVIAARIAVRLNATIAPWIRVAGDDASERRAQTACPSRQDRQASGTVPALDLAGVS